MARNKRIFLNYPNIYSAEMDDIDDEKQNELANPFARCISDSQWKGLWRKGTSHFYTRTIDEILRVREYNSYFDEFRKQSLRIERD